METFPAVVIAALAVVIALGLLVAWLIGRARLDADSFEMRPPLEAINPIIVSHGGTFNLPVFDWSKSRGCPGPADGPVCGGNAWHPGPEGGMAVNIKCAKCGTKFNFCPPFAAQRIDNDDRFYRLGVVRTLETL